MLNIQINNPKLEENIKQTFGDDASSLSLAFAQFIQHYKIKKDVEISIQQLDAGEGVEMKDVMAEIHSKYE